MNRDFTNEPESAVIADLAERAAAREAFEIVPGEKLGVLVPEGHELTVFDLEDFALSPRRKAGTVGLGDAMSFVSYVNRHAHHRETTLWGNLDAGSVTAVLNDHAADVPESEVTSHQVGGPGWGDHRAVLTLPSTPDWKHWLSQDGKLMRQSDFAEHLEDGASCIRRPEASIMIEIAQSFQAATSVEFKSGFRTQSGETKLQFEETTAARAGVAGSIDIPDSLTLELQPFEAGPSYEVIARFRYRIQQGALTLGYRLIRPDLARRMAFADICSEIEDRTSLGVLAGQPRR